MVQGLILQSGTVLLKPKYAIDPLWGVGRRDFLKMQIPRGFPDGSVGKESACLAGDLGSIPGSGRYPGEENGNPLQYSCLENSMDRGVGQATVPGMAESWTRLCD